jgi:hypothetical protein
MVRRRRRHAVARISSSYHHHIIIIIIITNRSDEARWLSTRWLALSHPPLLPAAIACCA